MVTMTSVRKTLPLIALAALSLASPAWAQKGGKLPAEGFTAGGIPVILSPADNEIVSVIVGVEGGLAGGETNNPVLAEFTSDVITSSGSASISKEELRKFLARTSTTITGGGDYRGMNFTMTTTRSNFDQAWAVLASMLTAPRFDGVEYRNIMAFRTAMVKRRWSNPENYASIIADSLVKLGNPVLGRSVRLEDVEGVTIPMMEEFAKRTTERSRMLVVVVGNISQNDIKKKLEAFSSLPAGRYTRPKLPPLAAAGKPTVELVDRPGSPTTYVQTSFAGPAMDNDEFWALQVGLNHLRSILFEELRTKRNLTYAPGSFLTSTLGQSRGVLSVSSTRPDSAIAIMYHELDRMRRGEIDEKELESSKQVFITSLYMRQMNNSGTATALYSAQLNSGDWRRAFSLDAINAVNKAKVQKAIATYARNLQVGIVGSREKVTVDKYRYQQ